MKQAGYVTASGRGKFKLRFMKVCLVWGKYYYIKVTARVQKKQGEKNGGNGEWTLRFGLCKPGVRADDGIYDHTSNSTFRFQRKSLRTTSIIRAKGVDWLPSPPLPSWAAMKMGRDPMIASFLCFCCCVLGRIKRASHSTGHGPKLSNSIILRVIVRFRIRDTKGITL